MLLWNKINAKRSRHDEYTYVANLINPSSPYNEWVVVIIVSVEKTQNAYEVHSMRVTEYNIIPETMLNLCHYTGPVIRW